MVWCLALMNSTPGLGGRAFPLIKFIMGTTFCFSSVICAALVTRRNEHSLQLTVMQWLTLKVFNEFQQFGRFLVEQVQLFALGQLWNVHLNLFSCSWNGFFDFSRLLFYFEGLSSLPRIQMPWSNLQTSDEVQTEVLLVELLRHTLLNGQRRFLFEFSHFRVGFVTVFKTI